MMKKNFLLLSLLAVVLVIFSCEKEPDNPYETVNYDTDTTTSPVADPTTIVGLHRNIFFPRCAKSGCHDGTFEPDYRTVMSTYSTLVYQPVIKDHCGDDTSQYFKMRVIPYNADSSFLIERLTTSTSDYMPSNGNKLSTTEINYIRTWISNGARDENGNVPTPPNLPPVVNAVFAVSQTPPYAQFDTNRVDDVPYNSWVFPADSNAYIVFTATDDSTQVPNYTVNQLKLSYDKDDFSNAITVNAVYNAIAHLWLVPVSANNFTPNTPVYYRYYVSDGDHATPTEFPRNDYAFYYKYYCSFIVQ